MRSMEKANRNTEGLKPPSWYESLSLLFLSLSSLLCISLFFFSFVSSHLLLLQRDVLVKDAAKVMGGSSPPPS